MSNKSGFSLLETLIILIIVSILVSLGIVSFIKTMEATYDREAITNLKIMQCGQYSYMISEGRYYPSLDNISDIASINNNLSVFVSGGSSRAWNYTAYSTGCVQAERNGYDNRTWYMLINDTDEEPNSGACP